MHACIGPAPEQQNGDFFITWRPVEPPRRPHINALINGRFYVTGALIRWPSRGGVGRLSDAALLIPRPSLSYYSEEATEREGGQKKSIGTFLLSEVQRRWNSPSPALCLKFHVAHER